MPEEKEFYLHILNWGPIYADSPEEAAKKAHAELQDCRYSGVYPVYTVTYEEIDAENIFLLPMEEFDSELWWEDPDETKD